ncbi:MAG TPA: TIGR03618 family F420-dependent PPOX class oxidoreductase [Acidimicrobiia bacterium]|nr:TIGR03618 family F420-dependent PPOX class oxidoreductase [Acidimicrobiia bacterium]
MASLEYVRDLVRRDHGLAVVVTQRGDGTPQASIANAGVLAHPVRGDAVVGIVVRGDTRKHANLRRRPRATVVFRVGWEWVAVEGPVELAGPDDALAGLDPGRVPPLLREVFSAAGGTHDDWDEYDRVMAAERRVAVLVAPERVYSNPGS